MICTTLTAKEYYRLHGELTQRQIEDLLDLHEAAQGNQGTGINGAVAHIDEARGCFMSEDFLTEHLDNLRTLAKRLRGDNRMNLQDIIEAIEEDVQQEVHTGEYGADELRQALDVLGAMA